MSSQPSPQPRPDPRKQLADLIRHLRTVSKLTLRQVEEQTRRERSQIISTTAMSNFQTGERAPSPELLEIILRVLRADVEQIAHARMLLALITHGQASEGEIDKEKTQSLPEYHSTPAQSNNVRYRSWLKIGAFCAATLTFAAALIAIVAKSSLITAFQDPTDSPKPSLAETSPTPPLGSSGIPTDRAPDATAQAANGAAHAEFYRDRGRFLLYDDRGEGDSAILIVKINGQQQEPWYNSRGRTTRAPDGTRILNPPKPIDLPLFDPRATLEFRVCTGPSGQPIPLETCGPWTNVQPIQ